LTTVVHVDSLHLIAPCMRSDIIEDYIFPALEYLRPQEDDFSPGSGANTAVSNALALYKQSSEPCSVRTEIFDPGATFPLKPATVMICSVSWAASVAASLNRNLIELCLATNNTLSTWHLLRKREATRSLTESSRNQYLHLKNSISNLRQ
jgi:hypothetical protein